MKIENRTFIISGGASGLGRACVEEICNNGGNVAILDMNEEQGLEFAKELGDSAKFFVCNVLETESITAAVQGTVSWIKETGKALGGVIPAAGVSTPSTILGRDGSAFSLDDFDFVLNVNLRGTIDLVRQSLEQLAQTPPSGPDSERGVVIMVASSAAFDGQKGQVSYSASKGAVAAMTLPMARDLARYGIRVVTIAPSLFESRMTSMMSADELPTPSRHRSWHPAHLLIIPAMAGCQASGSTAIKDWSQLHPEFSAPVFSRWATSCPFRSESETRENLSKTCTPMAAAHHISS